MTGEERPATDPGELQAAPTVVLGAYIRAQRRMADLSLRQLAEMTDISNAYLSQLERGLHQPSLRVLRSIANALQIPGEDLLSHAGIRPAARDVAPETGGARPRNTEAAILADTGLSKDEKDVLVRLYRTFRARRTVDDVEGSRGSRPPQQ